MTLTRQLPPELLAAFEGESKMRLLLDTNALLWALTNGPRIDPVRELLLADENEVFVSTVSWWGNRHQNEYRKTGRQLV